jgi:histidinol dehydrogenase
VIRLARADLAALSADIATIADTEGLTAHRRSVEARLGSSGNTGP